ncbi:MAG: hypothetical protein K2I06_11200 [Ruminococcus sp.]|nr:hypothetical protein [Ruminococcus sp.]
MEGIFCLAYLAVVVYILYKRYNASASSAKKKDMDFTSVSEHLNLLNEISEKLQVIEELITDISICSPEEHQKSISIEWTSASGKKNQYDIWVDGECTNTKEILKFAYSERDRLRCSLQSETKKLSERCNGNCNGNYTILDRGERK